MKRFALIAAVATTLVAGAANAQYPIADMIANKVIQKYQTSTCEQLWQEKAQGQGKPKPEMEQKVVAQLQSDPQMAQYFLNKISAHIVNKMFQCGMIR